MAGYYRGSLQTVEAEANPGREAMGKLFGTDGVRGVANIHPMTGEMAMQIGRAAAHLFKNRGGRHRIVIGKDTRMSGYMLETALASGICSMGVDVLLVGPMPTPGIAFMTQSMRADAGVMISASHNPFYDNGIKIFSNDGFKLPDEMEEKIETLISSESIHALRPTASDVGKAFRIDDARGRYIVFLKNTFPSHLSLDGLKIVLDCANGAAYRVAPTVLEELGADVIPVGVDPDGENINLNCGSLHPEIVSRMVRETGADLGMALDGDADRIVFIDRQGNLVDGDHIMAICATDMIREKRLEKNTLVTTVMSNMGLEMALKACKGRVVKTAVGDRYVVGEMRRNGYNLGGEKSGHMIFLDHITTGDGIVTALQVLSIMVKKEKPLDDLASIMTVFPQVLFNVRVKEKKEISQIREVHQKIQTCERELGKTGRIVIRYSGTEPVIRLMLEGESEDQIHEMGGDLARAIEKALG
jgi:phosphoglucosamine mutase